MYVQNYFQLVAIRGSKKNPLQSTCIFWASYDCYLWAPPGRKVYFISWINQGAYMKPNLKHSREVLQVFLVSFFVSLVAHLIWRVFFSFSGRKFIPCSSSLDTTYPGYETQLSGRCSSERAQESTYPFPPFPSLPYTSIHLYADSAPLHIIQ